MLITNEKYIFAQEPPFQCCYELNSVSVCFHLIYISVSPSSLYFPAQPQSAAPLSVLAAGLMGRGAPVALNGRALLVAVDAACQS